MPDGGIIGKVIVGIASAALLWFIYKRGRDAEIRLHDVEAEHKANRDVDLLQFEIEESARRAKQEDFRVDEWN
jgi:hypothetical protein